MRTGTRRDQGQQSRPASSAWAGRAPAAGLQSIWPRIAFDPASPLTMVGAIMSCSPSTGSPRAYMTAAPAAKLRSLRAAERITGGGRPVSATGLSSADTCIGDMPR